VVKRERRRGLRRDWRQSEERIGRQSSV